MILKLPQALTIFHRSPGLVGEVGSATEEAVDAVDDGRRSELLELAGDLGLDLILREAEVETVATAQGRQESAELLRRRLHRREDAVHGSDHEVVHVGLRV